MKRRPPPARWVDLSVRRLHGEGMRRGDARARLRAAPAELNLQEGFVITLQPVHQKVIEERCLLQRANHDFAGPLRSRCLKSHNGFQASPGRWRSNGRDVFTAVANEPESADKTACREQHLPPA
jgi:hypothetical protein